MHLQKNRINGTVAVSMGLELFNKLYPLLLIQIIHQRIGLTHFGYAQLGLALVEVSVPFITFGYDHYCAIFMHKIKDQRRALFSSGVVLKLAGAALVLLCAFAFVSSLPSPNEYRFLFWALSFTCVCNALDASWIFIGSQKVRMLSWLNFAAKFVAFVLILVAVNSPDDAVKYAVLSCIAGAIVNLATFAYGLKCFGFAWPRWEFAAKVFKGSLPFAGVAVLLILFQRLDLLLVKWLLSPEDVGLYAGIMRLNHSIFNLLTMVSLVVFSEQTAAKTKAETTDIYLQGLFIASLVLFPIVAGVWLVDANLLALVLGESFREQGTTFSILVASNLGAMGMALFGKQILLPKGRSSMFCLSLALGLLVCIASAQSLAPWGTLGIALALVLGKLVSAGHAFFVCKHYLTRVADGRIAWNLVLTALALAIPALLPLGFVATLSLAGSFYCLSAVVFYRKDFFPTRNKARG